MYRLACVIISWIGCAIVVVTAYQSHPVPVSIGDALTLHARFEATLARQQSERDHDFDRILEGFPQ